MSGLIKTNKDVYASYLFTVAKYDFSIYEKRIIYRLVEMAQAEIEGMLLKDNLRKVHKNEKTRTVTMPIASILKDEKDENYSVAKKAFKSLACKGLEYENDEIWVFINIIAAPKFNKSMGTASFEVYDEIWQCLLNFTKGFRKYELKTIMGFKSTYTMRMYELMSGQKTPLTFVNESFESLCDRFKLPKTMRRPQIFEEKVLDMAQKELDEFAPYSFTYKRETIPWRGRTGYKVIGYTFYPVSIPKNRDQALETARLQAKVGNIASPNFGMLRPEVSEMLFHLDYTKDEINRNKELFIRAQRIFTPDGMIDKLEQIRQSALRKKRIENVKGYIINGLKIALKEAAPDQMPISDETATDTASTTPSADINNIASDLANKFKI